MAGEAASHSPNDRARLRRRVFWRRAVVEGGRWLYGALRHLLFALGLLALAGIVVVVFDWPVWLIAPVIGLILLAALAEGAYRVWRESASKVRVQQSAELTAAKLHADCAVTAASIESFVLQRRDAVPKLPPEEIVALTEGDLPPEKEVDHKWALLGHEQDTKTLYEEQFASRVSTIVVALRERGHVREADLEWLNHPRDLEGIERVGKRLWELAVRIQPERSEQTKQ